MSKFFWTLIDNLIDELRKNDNLEDVSTQTPLRLNKKEREVAKKISPSSIFEFHQELNGLSIGWTPKDKDPDVLGAVKILSLKEILRDWKGIIYFDFTSNEDRIRRFHPIDFFIAETCAGAFLDEDKKQDCSLYLYGLGAELINLNLNINGYIRMMVLSKGFLYWQDAVREILEGRENPESQRFKEWMPRLFPDFSWKDYIQSYNQLKT